LYCVGSMGPVNGGYANDGGVNDGVSSPED
jgi:hypothetical protein